MKLTAFICVCATIVAAAVSPTAAHSNCRPAALVWADRGPAATAVVDRLVAGDFEGIRSDFSDELRNQLSADQMREVWNSVTTQIGTFKRQGAPEAHRVDDVDVILIRCEFERAPAQVEVDFRPDGKIVALWIRPTQ